MAVTVVEFFGKRPGDEGWTVNSRTGNCPFRVGKCNKLLHGGERSGVCTLKAVKDSRPVICCPVRLYGNDYEILRKVCDLAFGEDVLLNSPGTPIPLGTPCVRMFGKDFGGELRLPTIGGKSAYWVDWILARVDAAGELQEFSAVEVQTIDTTGNYREQRRQLLRGNADAPRSKDCGFNWENVSKRILPQIIYKGNVLRRETLCNKGLFFVCPTKVYEQLISRLGGDLEPFPALDRGTVTFLHYGLSETSDLVLEGTLTTGVEILSQRFSTLGRFPAANTYETAIRNAIAPWLAP